MKIGGIEVNDSIINALQEDKLVILAGAGVSMSSPCSCPDFETLAVEIGKLNSEPYDKTKYKIDEYLGILNEKGIEVKEQSKAIMYSRHNDKDLEQKLKNLRPTPMHYNLIKLSRGKSKRDIRIVTTNFEHYFTKAYKDCLGDEEVSTISYAPDLPTDSIFSGLVYLHGAYEDTSKDAELVITKVDFGKAYLEPGYAREFMKKLFLSEYTVLIIGYSYDDYIVNMLTLVYQNCEKNWFAFDGINDESERDEREAHWKRLGIKPILYEADKSHSVLGSSIEKFARYSVVSDGKHITYEEHSELVENLTQDIADISSDGNEFLLSKINEGYTSVFCKKASEVEHLRWCEEVGLLNGLFSTYNIENGVFYSWAVNKFFKFPNELFRIKQTTGTSISGVFWEKIIRCFCYYIEDNKQQIDISYLNERLDILIPFILEYNPIKLSLSNEGYKFVITWLVEQLLLVDDNSCFKAAMKLFLYITTSHTTIVYDNGCVQKKVRFYGDEYSLNEISNNFTEKSVKYITRKILAGIVTNIENAKEKLNLFDNSDYGSHIRNKQEIYSLITLLKKYLAINPNVGSSLYKKIMGILNDVAKIEKLYDSIKSESFWVSPKKQQESVNIEFLKQTDRHLIVEWINNPKQYSMYCRNEFGFDYKDSTNFLGALGDAFADDPEFIADIICFLEDLPDGIFYAIPHKVTVHNSDTKIINSIKKLLSRSGAGYYYRSVVSLLNNCIDENKVWFKQNFDEIERIAFSVRGIIRSYEDEENDVDKSRKDYLLMSLNSLGGEYGKLIVECFELRYEMGSTAEKIHAIPEHYIQIINEILSAGNFNTQMARVIVYRNIYFFNSRDKEQKLSGLFEGLYLDDSSDELLFVQAWQGFLWSGKVYDTNISDLFTLGISNCIAMMKSFGGRLREQLVNYLVVMSKFVNEISPEIFIATLFNAINELSLSGESHSLILRNIFRHIKDNNRIDLDFAWNGWLKKFIGTRVSGTGIPDGVEFDQSELERIIWLAYYLSPDSHDSLLDYIAQGINLVDESKLRGFSLLIENPFIDPDFVIEHENRLAIAKVFKITARKHTVGQFHYAKNSLLRIIYNNGKKYQDVLDIVKKGIHDSKLDYDDRRGLIDCLENPE